MREACVPGAVGVVLAAGTGTRVGADGSKAYLRLGGRSMVSWSLAAVAAVPDIARTVLVIRRGERDLAERTCRTRFPPPEWNSSKAATAATPRSSTSCSIWRPTSNRARSTWC